MPSYFLENLTSIVSTCYTDLQYSTKMASNAPCKRCLVIPGPGKCLSKLFKMKPMLHSADHKNYIKPKLKDLKILFGEIVIVICLTASVHGWFYELLNVFFVFEEN